MQGAGRGEDYGDQSDGCEEGGCDEGISPSQSSPFFFLSCTEVDPNTPQMDADTFIATSSSKDWPTTHASTLDLIISTVSSPHMPLESYLLLLPTNGTFIQVGAPEDKMPPFGAFSLIAKGAKIGGSAIGAPREIEEMLEMAVERGVKPWIQTRGMGEANEAVVDMDMSRARYRFVLVNERHA